MTFTQDTPKVAGAYWWKASDTDAVMLVEVMNEKDSDGLFVKTCGQTGVNMPVYMRGLWCRLVPASELDELKAKMAEEIEKAYRESWDDAKRDTAFGRFEFEKFWNNSRSFRIAKG
jgi:hypothetical protein